MNVPLPAAVNESVKLTRALGKSSAAGMVNAVLRRAAAAGVQLAAYDCRVTPDSLTVGSPVPVRL